jgi:hypothetical protein
VEVELEHQSWGVSAVTAVENVSGIRKNFQQYSAQERSLPDHY